MGYRKSALIMAILFALPGPLTTSPVYSERLEVGAVLNQGKMKPSGEQYEATVPDTLDLAERAKLSINVLLGNIDPSKEYSVYQGFTFDKNPPVPGGLTWNIQHKNIRALPLLRTMCGSERGTDLEYAVMQNVLRQINEDGLVYFPIGGDNVAKGTSHPLINALVVLAMENWYARDKNPEWLKWMQLICKGMDKIAIKRDDRAYYPLESGYSPDGQWHWTQRGKAITPYTPPDEPVLDYQGIEGAVKFDNAVPMRAFVRSYKYTGGSETLAMAERLSRFLLKPSMWMDTSGDGYMGYEHGLFNGHFHGNVTPLYSLLDLAIAEKNDWLKQFVREGYDHARRGGVARMGFFPGWLMPEKCDRVDSYAGWAEGCGISDTLILAVKLSDAGLGDYWDDVDYYLRNQLIEQQFTNLELMRKLSGNDPQNDKLLASYVGGFGAGEPTAISCNIYGCCSANGAIGLYYAWHGITRFQNGIAKVNLFLNRASPWMDIDSSLPYEGRVLLHNKQARSALVRIPAWLDADQLKCFLNNRSVQPAAIENYLTFENLKEKDQIRLEFPVPQGNSSVTIHRTRYRILYRGSTIVDIQPRKRDSKWYPMYQRDFMNATNAPMHKVTRFVSNHILPLQ